MSHNSGRFIKVFCLQTQVDSANERAAMSLAACSFSSIEAAPPQVPAVRAFYTHQRFFAAFSGQARRTLSTAIGLACLARRWDVSWQVHQSAAPAEGRFRSHKWMIGDTG